MRSVAGAVLMLLAAACTTQSAPPTAATLAPVSTPVPISGSGLRVGQMAIVVAGQLRQVADPNQPADRAFESAANAGARILRPLGESQHVLVVGGPTNPNGDVYWQVADDAFPGCCAPFGWVREASSNGAAAIEPLTVACPAGNVPLDGDQLVALGVMEVATCFGSSEFSLRGEVRCDRPSVDSFVSITGPDWANDQTLCILDNAVALYGAVTQLYTLGSAAGAPFDDEVDLIAHFNDASAHDCRWAPGSFMPIPIDNAPVETAQFACRMSIYVTQARPVDALAT
jgi:hypothetical protein